MGHGMDVIKLAQHGLLTGFVVWGLLPSVHAKTWVLTDTSRISFDIKTVGLSAVKGVSNQSQAKLYFGWCFKKYAPMKRRQRDTIRLYLNV